MAIEFPPLPWPPNALEPIISEKTMDFHWGKHHRGYVEKVNKLIQGTQFEDLPLEEIILVSSRDEDHKNIFNNAAQAWNHDFFWKCMTPKKNSRMSDGIKNAVEKYFSSFDELKTKFNESGKNLFGSGWSWLVKNGRGALEVVTTKNADTPIVHGQVPLLTCDVWEHAYYLDYQNDRAAFLKNFWDIVDWSFVEKNLNSGVYYEHRPYSNHGISLQH